MELQCFKFKSYFDLTSPTLFSPSNKTGLPENKNVAPHCPRFSWAKEKKEKKKRKRKAKKGLQCKRWICCA